MSDANIQLQPSYPLKNNNRRSSNGSVSGSGKKGGQLVVSRKSSGSAYDFAVGLDFSNGIPESINNNMSFFQMLQQLNCVIGLNPYAPQSLLPGMDIVLVKDSLDAYGKYTYDKLILVLQISDIDSMGSISAKLSADGTVVSVDIPAKDR